MEDIFIKEKIPGLSELGNIIPERYLYHKKKITPGALLKLAGACLKWYELYPPEADFTREQVQETRKFIETEAEASRLKLENELGFVILHRAGDYLLLLITTWRNTNEMWETVYLKKAGESENFIPVKFKSDHKETYCVWELGIVWHERNAWVSFIESKRDEEAKLIYIDDLFTGVI